MSEAVVDIIVKGDQAVRSVKKVDKSFDSLEKEIKGADQSVKKFGKTVGGATTQSVEKLSRTVERRAVTSMTSFNRIVQDAPFGLIAVQNNITELAQNFGNLTMSSGGAGAALKAMGASLMGPAGIIALVSLVTAVATQFGDEILEAMSGGAIATKELKAALDELISVEFSFDKFFIGGLEDIDAAVEALEENIKVARSEIERPIIETGILAGLKKVVPDTDEIRAMELGIKKLQDMREEFEVLSIVSGALEGNIHKVVKLLQDDFSFLEADDAFLDRLLGDVSLAVRQMENHFQRLLQIQRDFIVAWNTDVDELIGEEDGFLFKMFEKDSAEMAKFIKANENFKIAIVTAEQQKQAAFQRTLEATIAVTDTSIRSAEDVAFAVVHSSRQIIQAQLGILIAKTLASLGPAALVVGAAAAAGINVLFNSLVPEPSGSFSASGGGAGAPIRTHSDRGVGGFQPTFGSIQNTPSSGNSALLFELQRNTAAIQSQEFRLRGTDLVAASDRTNADYQRAGIQ